MAPHRPRKSAPAEYATDEEDMITYGVEELEPDPTDKFTIKEDPLNFPKGIAKIGSCAINQYTHYTHPGATARGVKSVEARVRKVKSLDRTPRKTLKPRETKFGKSALDLNPISPIRSSISPIRSSISPLHSPISPKNDPFKLQGCVHYTPLVTSHWQDHKSLHTALGLISVLLERNSQSLPLVLLECTGARPRQNIWTLCPSRRHCSLKAIFS
ncbi:hypothetical protein TNCV_505681 [Trichonephila clavipes]|nr:hypothetical protein TNCV_505681 [Trichonephila clavipes]